MDDNPSPDLWRYVFDHLPDGATVHASSGKILYANRRIAEIYGKPVDSMVDGNCEMFFHGDNSPCPHYEVVSELSSASVDINMGVEKGVYNVLILPIIGANHFLRGYIRLMRKSAEGEGSRSLALIQLIATVAHKIGTPLNIISGYSEYLLMRMRPDDEGYKELSTILQQTRRISEGIRQMLDEAKSLQSGAGSLKN